MGECIYDNPPASTSGRRSETHYPVRIEASGDYHGVSLPTPEDQASNVGTFHAQPSTIGSSTPITTTPLSQASTHEMETLRNRIRLLEGQVSNNTPGPPQPLISTPASNTETSSTQLGGTFHIHSQLQPDGAIPLPRVISHKTRMFGQSHFVTGLPLV
jgi:hypothetical protein